MSDMSELFILQNHDNLFLGKQKEWLDGRDPGSLFKTPYKDEAVNQMFEVNSKDYTQRIKVVCCKANEKGLPIIDQAIAPGTPSDNEPRLIDEENHPVDNSGSTADEGGTEILMNSDLLDDVDVDVDVDNSDADLDADNPQTTLL